MNITLNRFGFLPMRGVENKKNQPQIGNLSQLSCDTLSFKGKNGKTEKQSNIEKAIDMDCITNNKVKTVIQKMINAQDSKPVLTSAEFKAVVSYFGYKKQRKDNGDDGQYTNDYGCTFVFSQTSKSADPGAVNELMNALSNLDKTNGELIFQGRSAQEAMQRIIDTINDKDASKRNNQYRANLEAKEKLTAGNVEASEAPREIPQYDYEKAQQRKYNVKKIENAIGDLSTELDLIYEEMPSLKAEIADKNLEDDEDVKTALDQIEAQVKKLEAEVRYFRKCSDNTPDDVISQKAEEASEAEAMITEVIDTFDSLSDCVRSKPCKVVEPEIPITEETPVTEEVSTSPVLDYINIEEIIPEITEEDKKGLSELINTLVQDMNLSSVSEQDIEGIVENIGKNKEVKSILDKYKIQPEQSEVEQIEEKDSQVVDEQPISDIDEEEAVGDESDTETEAISQDVVKKDNNIEMLLREYRNSKLLFKTINATVEGLSLCFPSRNLELLRNDYISLFTVEELRDVDMRQDEKMLKKMLLEKAKKFKREKEQEQFGLEVKRRIQEEKDLERARAVQDTLFKTIYKGQKKSAKQSAEYLEEALNKKEQLIVDELEGIDWLNL